MKMLTSRYIEQSAVIPFRFKNGEPEILVITSRRGKRWVIPKGIIEPDMTPAESALQEAKEEAGAYGLVYDKLLGTYKYDKWGGTCRVEVYLMQVQDLRSSWLEDYRTREWVNVKQAAKRVKEKKLKEIILKVPEIVKSNLN